MPVKDAANRLISSLADDRQLVGPRHKQQPQPVERPRGPGDQHGHPAQLQAGRRQHRGPALQHRAIHDPLRGRVQGARWLSFGLALAQPVSVRSPDSALPPGDASLPSLAIL